MISLAWVSGFQQLPWIEKGTVVHGPINGPAWNSEYEAASIPATLKKIFNLQADYLNTRDAWAGTFEHIFANRSESRTDCPLILPDAPLFYLMPQENLPVDDLQRDFLRMASGLNGVSIDTYDLTEFASVFVKEQVSKFFGPNCMTVNIAKRTKSCLEE